MPPPGTQCSPIWQPGLEAGPEAEERTERERKEHAVARRAPVLRDTPPSSSRASTASSRWCRSSAAAGRWSTTSGSSACSWRAARSAPCPTADSPPDRHSAPPSSSAAASGGRPESAARRRRARLRELARVERIPSVNRPQQLRAADAPWHSASAVAIQTARPRASTASASPADTSNRAAILGGNRPRLHRLPSSPPADAHDRDASGRDLLVALRQRADIAHALLADRDDADAHVELVLEPQRPVIVEARRTRAESRRRRRAGRCSGPPRATARARPLPCSRKYLLKWTMPAESIS